MSTLSVSSIQNTASPTTNIVVNADGSVTLGLYRVPGVAPTPVQTGTLWYDIGGAGLVIWDGAAWASAGGGGGTVTGVAGTAPIVSSGGATPAISITPATSGAAGSMSAADKAKLDGAATIVSAVTGTLPITVATGTSTPVIAINAATTALPGSIQLATAAENAAGTDATKAVTPAFSVPKDAANMTGAAILPSGATGTRPGTPTVGMTRVNTTTNSPETYVNSAWSPIQSTQSGQFAGFRNLLINGNYTINQRGYVSGTATTGANEYTLDRWKVLVSGQNLTFAASGNGNQVTAPAGGLQQVIEDINVGGGTYTLSWTGTATAAVNGSAVVNGGQVTLPANTQATVTFTGGTVSQAQLEPGGVASPFEQRGVTTETSLCQRYFIQQSYRCSGMNSQATKSVATVNYAPMRTTPTLVFVSGAVLYGVNLSGNQPIVNIDAPGIDNTSFASGCNIAGAALVVNESSLIVLLCSLSAEL